MAISTPQVIRTERASVKGHMNACARNVIVETGLLAVDPGPGGAGVTMRGDETVLSAQEGKRLLSAVANERDRSAFAALFGFYAPRLKAFMMRAGMSASVAEDIAQETMLIVWKKASYFDPARAGASTWIFTIARNVRIDRLRRERRPAALMNAFDPSDEPEGPVSGEAAVLAEERDERVRAALGLLSPEQAQIIHLSFFADKPQTAIASELGIPLGTVKSRIRLAFGRLRTILDTLQ